MKTISYTSFFFFVYIICEVLYSKKKKKCQKSNDNTALSQTTAWTSLKCHWCDAVLLYFINIIVLSGLVVLTDWWSQTLIIWKHLQNNNNKKQQLKNPSFLQCCCYDCKVLVCPWWYFHTSHCYTISHFEWLAFACSVNPSTTSTRCKHVNLH